MCYYVIRATHTHTHTHTAQWESDRWRLQQYGGLAVGLCGSLGGLTADRKINGRKTHRDTSAGFTQQGDGGEDEEGEQTG